MRFDTAHIEQRDHPLMHFSELIHDNIQKVSDELEGEGYKVIDVSVTLCHARHGDGVILLFKSEKVIK